MLERRRCSHPECRASTILDQSLCLAHSPDPAGLSGHLLRELVTNTVIRNLNLAGLVVRDCNFEKKVFSGLDFRGGHFESCTFATCHFSLSFLDSCSFKDCSFNECKFIETVFAVSSFDTVRFTGCDILQCNFNGGGFRHSSFFDNDMMYSRFVGALFEMTVIEDCNLKSVHFSRPTLPEFKYCNPEDAIYQ